MISMFEWGLRFEKQMARSFYWLLYLRSADWSLPPHFTNADPNNSLSRSAPMSRPSVMSSKYHGPSFTSP